MKTGMTVGQVERQGRMNKGDYSGWYNLLNFIKHLLRGAFFIP
jgi:hypothetical protein